VNPQTFSGACAMAVVAGLISTTAQADSALQFRDAVRTLENFQDATARGDQYSANLLPRMMTQLETDLLSASDEEVRDSKNIRALITYVLSGGNPDVVGQRTKKLNIVGEYGEILSGAVAYARGDKKLAIALLGRAKIFDLPRSIGGRLALAKAVLVSDTDLKGALILLGVARDMMPGSLVEEAALRRCVGFTARIHELNQFESCASTYFRHFPNSIYWKDFVTTFTSASALLDDKKTSYFSSWLLPALDDMPPQVEIEIMLLIAKKAVVAGNFMLADNCASRANSLADIDSEAKNQALLYAGAAMMGLNEYEAGKGRLEAVNPARLAEDDAALLRKALSVSNQIAQQPSLVGEEVAPIRSSARKDDLAALEIDEVVARAKQVLAKIPDESVVTSQ
jgi:chemotaxis protein MotC